jgi:hypothetical protein
MSTAIYIVHWPGKDVPACEEHAGKLVSVGRCMGFEVSFTLYFGDAPCTNCENEARLPVQQDSKSTNPEGQSST